MASEDSNVFLRLFGFEIKRAAAERRKEQLPSPVPKTDDDGAGYVTAAGSHFGQYINFEQDDAKDNAQLIKKYRGVASHPEVDMAVDEIVNEAISSANEESSIQINLDNVEASDGIKKKIIDEFDDIVKMLKFNDNGYDMFKRWYIDGRMVHHIVVDEKNLKKGIQELRHMDAAKVRKVKQIKYKKDAISGARIVDRVEEFFIYEEKPGVSSTGIKMTLDSVSYITSGLLDESRKKVISHLHKSLKAVNQLRMMEDALVIYRLARAPERRIFYIDTGNMAKGKAEEYMKGIMAKYRNKLVYDASTGELKDDRKHMSMLEDFWLPRREGGRGTEISTLPGGENLGQIDDIVFMQKKLYRSLNVPINRLEQEAQFSLGRSTEVTRDEVKFQKFIDRLRRRFGYLFINLLEKQLIMKQVVTQDDWDEWVNDIFVDFVRDNYFVELKEAEILRERLQTLDMVSNYTGQYFSKEWIFKKVLQMDDEEIKELKAQMKKEQAEEPQMDEFGNPINNMQLAPPNAQGALPPPHQAAPQPKAEPKPKEPSQTSQGEK